MTDRSDARDTPPELVVVPWGDHTAGAVGHRPGSPYIEGVWLGAIGPSATWAWQRLARLAETRPGSKIDTLDLAVSLGLGQSLGHNASISRTLRRLDAFDIIRQQGGVVAVKVRLPDVPERRLGQLSPTARIAHERFSLRNQLSGRPQAVGVSSGLAI